MKSLKTALLFLLLFAATAFSPKAHAQIGPWPCGGSLSFTTYQQATPYVTGNVVIYYGITYQATANSTGQHPCSGMTVNSAYWTQTIGTGSGSLPTATRQGQVPTAGPAPYTYTAQQVSNAVCVENFLSNSDGHGGADYGAAFNAADAFLQTSGSTNGVIAMCTPGNHPVWTPLVESWPVALFNGSGSVLVPQSGGANGIWGESELTASCTVTAGSATVTCSSTTGLTAGMAVGGIGLADANRIVSVNSGTQFTLAIPAVLVVNGQTTNGSNQVCGLNTIRGLATSQGISGTGIPSSTTITAITPYSTANGQCLTLSNNATATSTQYVVGNTVNAPVALTISGSWTATLTAENTANVLEIPYNASAPLNWASQNYTGKIEHLTIQDPSYRTLTGVRGIEVYGEDGFVSNDISVYNIRGTCLTLGGYDSTEPLRESFFSDTKCVNDGDLPTGQSAIEVMSQGTSGSDEINQIKFSGGEIVYTHGEGVTFGTYIVSHQGSNGPRIIFFSNNFQIESGNADPNNPDIATPADNVHVLTGNRIFATNSELAVPGYGHALWRQDNTGASNSYQVDESSLVSAGNRVSYTVTVTNGSANITLPSGLTPTDGIFDGVGVQIGGVDYWFIPQNSVSGQTATLTQTYQGSSGTATMTIGAGGYFFFNTGAAGQVDTRSTVGNIWTEMDSLAISLLGFGSPINVGIDAGSLPGRGENDNLGLLSYNTLDVIGSSTFHGLAYTPGGVYSTGVIQSLLEGIFSNSTNIALSASTGANGSVNQPAQFTCPNTATGDDCALFLGLNNTTNNQSSILGWSNNSTAPYGWLGIFGHNRLIEWNQNSVSIQGPLAALTLYSVAGTPLPTCNAASNGQQAVVSDATSPTYMVQYTGGGTVTAAVICSGVSGTYLWKTH